jgi:hypothetical protein
MATKKPAKAKSAKSKPAKSKPAKLKPAKLKSKPSKAKSAKGLGLAPPARLGELPTATDNTFVVGKNPGQTATNPAANLADELTGPAVNALTSPTLAAYFGEQYAVAGLLAAAEQATHAQAARARFQNGVDLTAKIYADSASQVLARVSVLMSKWDAFSAAHPDEARALAGLRSWWLAHHKAGHAAQPVPTK